jgi:methylated-DNA-[protein]-cysteine S-methyltransferase
MSESIYSIWRSPLGWIGLAASQRGMTAITSPRSTRREARAEINRIVGAHAIDGENSHIRHAQGVLGRYFRQDPHADFMSVKLDESMGTLFEKQVWRRLREIPYGETRTYGDLARSSGRPRSARAVGRCNAKNPWAIVVPCHRVVGKNASLTGYGGGIEMKRRLLELEGVDVTALRATMLAAAPGRKGGHADRD